MNFPSEFSFAVFVKKLREATFPARIYIRMKYVNELVYGVSFRRKFILPCKEFVLLCKMIEKLQEISSSRSAYKVYHMGSRKSRGREWCWIRKLKLLKNKIRDLVNIIKLTGLYEKKTISVMDVTTLCEFWTIVLCRCNLNHWYVNPKFIDCLP